MNRTPLPDNATIPDLVKGQDELHDCLDDHVIKTEKAFIDASQHRQEIENKVDLLDSKICLVDTKVDDVVNQIKSAKAAIWKAACAGFIPLLSAVGWIVVHIWPLPIQGLATTQQLDNRTSLRYTSADAARDRDAQNLINQQVLSALVKIENK